VGFEELSAHTANVPLKGDQSDSDRALIRALYVEGSAQAGGQGSPVTNGNNGPERNGYGFRITAQIGGTDSSNGAFKIVQELRCCPGRRRGDSTRENQQENAQSDVAGQTTLFAAAKLRICEGP